MDKAYLNIRNNGRDRGLKDNSTFTIAKKKESSRFVDRGNQHHDYETYKKISSAFVNLHQQQVFFDGYYGHNDPFVEEPDELESFAAHRSQFIKSTR